MAWPQVGQVADTLVPQIGQNVAFGGSEVPHPPQKLLMMFPYLLGDVLGLALGLVDVVADVVGVALGVGVGDGFGKLSINVCT